MSARRAAFERIESALGDSVRRVGGVGGVDLGFRPDPGADRWIPIKLAIPIIVTETAQSVVVHQELDEHIIVIVDGDDVSYASSKQCKSVRPRISSLKPKSSSWTTLPECLSQYHTLCRSWEALELMSPVFRRHHEKNSVKVIAETSVVNKTIRRVFEEQGLGKHLITIGGKCGADFAFFPDPAVDLCLGVKVSGTSPGKYPNVTRFAIDKTLPYLFLAIHNTGVALVPVRDIKQSFNTVLGRSKFGLLEVSCVPGCVQRVCQDLGEGDGLRLVSLSEVQGASKSAFKLTSPHMLEAEGQDLVEKNLPPGVWTRTEEFCHADAVYGPLSAASLPIQIKTSSVTTKTGGYRFTLTQRYDNMLVMCIHLPSKTIYAVPGALLPNKTFSGRLLGSTEDGNTDYIVQPEELATFLESLHATVSAGKSHGSWPMDSQHDVSSIRMITHKDANIPREANQRKAQEYANYRRTMLPGLISTPPRVQHTPVDILLDGKRIQDKLASAMTKKGATGWTCTMFRDIKSRGILPYCDTDFDFLWIHINNNIFYLIPACALVHRGILSSSSGKGRTSIVVYPFGCVKDADLWANAFKLSYSDAGIEDKIRSILTQSEDSDGSEVPDTTTCDQSRNAAH